MRFERIQTLRFLAAAAVAAYHAQGTGENYLAAAPTALPFLKHGDWGVDLFFVISGFIIHYTASRRESDWRLFLRRRIERVVPLYWLCTIAMFALLMGSGLARTPGGTHWLDLPRSLLFLSWSAGGGQLPVVFVGWSLEYEMLFYVVTAAALALAPRAWLTVTLVFCALVFAGAVAGAKATSPLYLFVNPMLLEFLLGVAVAQLLLQRRLDPAAAGAIALAFGAVVWTGAAPRIWEAGVPSLALVGGAAWLDRRGTPVDPLTRATARLGDASYSIYLVHVFVISAVWKLLVRVRPAVSLDLGTVLVTAIAIAAAYVTYRLVERPLATLWRHARATGGDGPAPGDALAGDAPAGARAIGADRA